MAIDAKTLAASKKYTKETVEGAGAIKGKNCVIDSITPITGGNRVTFKWTLDSGTVQTGVMDVMDGTDGAPGAQGPQGPAGPAGADGRDGTDGLGIASVNIDVNEHLIITYDDGTTHDAGVIPSGGGSVTSVNGKNGTVTLYATDIKMSDAPDAKLLSVAIHDLDLLMASKVDKEAGKGLSTNDYTAADKTKLMNLEPIYLIGSGLNLDPATGKLTASGMETPIDTTLDETSPNPVQNMAIAIPVHALQGSMVGVKGDIINIELDLNQLSGSMLTVKGDVVNIKLDIAQLQGSMANVYTKSQVDNLIAAISTMNIEVVSALPTTDISQTTIYLVPKSTAFASNIYDEYINTDGTTAGWELIGDTAIDLTNYIQKSVSPTGLLRDDGSVDTQIKLDVAALQASMANVQLDITHLQGSMAGKANSSDVVALQLSVNQLSGSLLYKADKTDLDSWIGPMKVDANHKVAFDNLDDTQAYKLFGDDRLIRIEGQPHKDPGTITGTVKVTYTTDAPQNTDCWLRKIKK